MGNAKWQHNKAVGTRCQIGFATHEEFKEKPDIREFMSFAGLKTQKSVT